ncbi:MAG: UDP-glucose 4-epimerase [Bradymonadia bacterium]|jgi:UDP-glucose 4-epimerase
MDRALVTGGAGFIGSHLTRQLVADGLHVVVLDNLSSGHRHNLDGVDVEFVEGDIRDEALVRRASTGCRYVLHHAAMVSVPESVADPEGCHAINGGGTLNVLRAAATAGAERVTFAASAAAYGREPTLPKRESYAPEPISPYAATKLLGEHYCRVFTECYSLPCVPFRYFNIYGSQQDPSGAYAAVISKFVERMLDGVAPTIFGDGQQTRDFCHVSDVVRANMMALHAPADVAGRPMNIGTGETTTLLDLMATLNVLLGTSFDAEFGPERAGDIRHSCSDPSRVKDALGFVAETSLHDGLAELLGSLK